MFIICSLSLGPVFGNMDKFVGLGVFVDTYPNEEKQQEVMASVRAQDSRMDVPVLCLRNAVQEGAEGLGHEGFTSTFFIF